MFKHKLEKQKVFPDVYKDHMTDKEDFWGLHLLLEQPEPEQGSI